jgi:hypothetical protein
LILRRYTKVAFTIHNMNYGQAKIGQASHHAQVTTTVSPSYASEVSGHPAGGFLMKQNVTPHPLL